MKVTHIFKTYFPDTQGGLEESIRQIVRYTADYGVKNKILTASPRPDPVVIDFPEAKVVRFKTSIDILSTPISLDFLREFKKSISESDILHFHFPWPFGELAYLLCRPKIPTLVSYQSDIIKHKYVKKCYKPFLDSFLNHVNLIVPTSREYLESSIDLQPFKNKCTIIPNTIDSRRFVTERADLIKEVKEKHGKDFFLFVGMLRHYKGVDYLLRAMKGINKKLIIIGKGPEEQKLKKQSKALGLKNVSFLGYIDDIYLPAFYSLCQAFVFPSINRSEAFGMSLLEASLFSKPMITTELSTGTSVVNKNGVTGMVIPPKDIGALRNALKIMANNYELCEQMGDNAGKRYKRKFNHGVAGKKYLEVYEKLASLKLS